MLQEIHGWEDCVYLNCKNAFNATHETIAEIKTHRWSESQTPQMCKIQMSTAVRGKHST